MVCSSITVATPQPSVGIVSNSTGFVKSDGSQFASCLGTVAVVGTPVTIETTVRVSNASAKFNIQYVYTTNGVQSSATSAQQTQGIGDFRYVSTLNENYVAGGTYTSLVVSVINIVPA